MGIEILEKSKAAEIMVKLHERKEIGLVEMVVVLSGGSTSTINNRLLELKSVGLIEEEREAKFGGRRLFRLTDKGKKVARKLVEIEKLLA